MSKSKITFLKKNSARFFSGGLIYFQPQTSDSMDLKLLAFLFEQSASRNRKTFTNPGFLLRDLFQLKHSPEHPQQRGPGLPLPLDGFNWRNINGVYYKIW